MSAAVKEVPKVLGFPDPNTFEKKFLDKFQPAHFVGVGDSFAKINELFEGDFRKLRSRIASIDKIGRLLSPYLLTDLAVFLII